uniref:Branchpoint-bridging protein n=1 Tax=Globodera rostochiensis TaxID=31243 RepID=A0A914GTX4_GLORO
MKSTGGNLEPMPFVRKWGAAVDGENGAEGSQLPTEQCDDNGKHRNRSRSKSPSSKKHKKRSSRSPERKKHKKRSRSRESKHRKRDRSRESKRTKDRDEPQQQQNISAFPPPSDYLQQVQQRHQQEMQHLQKPTPIPLMQLQFKQETDYGGMEQQQSYGQLYQQDFQQPQQNARQSILQSQHELEQQEPEKKNDALSAALAAAAMVAQKLGKGGFTPGGGGGGGSGGALGSSADLLNRIPQTPQRATPISETVLAKEPVKNEPEQTLTEEQRQREQRRKSRWSTTKAFVPGMPTILPSDIDENQRQVYLFQMEIEETTRRLRQSDFGQNVDPAERSPSPEPVYDTTGKRLNTREVRKRQEIEQRRHEKIQALLRLNPNYKPPADYRPPNIKLHDKVWIPQEEHPEINFVGLLIGPRGNTLKALEAETGAKIIIRGKGSIKEGKLANRTGPLPGENEPLHAYVTSTDREAIKRGCDKIREIINAALMIPDGQNELRKLQLRELALLNGTLRPEDVLSGARCTNCGSDQHKTWECMEAPNVTANVICTACGGAGHIARDCKNPRPGFDGAMMDAEYSALMAELGEKPPISLEAGTAPPLVGGKPIPGFPGSGPRPRFALPAPTPIPIGGGGGYPGWDGSNFYGFSGLPGQDPAAAAAAWAAWQAGQSGFPAPVPPPPGGGFGPGGVDSSLTAGTSAGGLAMFPPPPPPPPPAPKHEIKEEFDSILSAPAPPPPPT